MKLAVVIHVCSGLKEPVYERTRPGIFIQQIMEDRINVKTITPQMRKRLKRDTRCIDFSLRSFQDEPPFSARPFSTVSKHPPTRRNHEFIFPGHGVGNS